MLLQQQPLLDADPHLHRDWLGAASAAAALVQLLYQVLTSKEYLTFLDQQQSKRRELLV
jgi:hypothetical protein